MGRYEKRQWSNCLQYGGWANTVESANYLNLTFQIATRLAKLSPGKTPKEYKLQTITINSKQAAFSPQCTSTWISDIYDVAVSW